MKRLAILFALLLPVFSFSPEASATTYREIKIECPLCQYKFTGKVFRSTNSGGGVDSDLCSYAFGNQVREFAVSTCPRCLYSNVARSFSATLKTGEKKALQKGLKGAKEKYEKNKSGVVTEEIPSHQRWLLAAQCAKILKKKEEERIHYLRQAAFCLRDKTVLISLNFDDRGQLSFPTIRRALDRRLDKLEDQKKSGQVEADKIWEAVIVAHRGGYLKDRNRLLKRLVKFKKYKEKVGHLKKYFEKEKEVLVRQIPLFKSILERKKLPLQSKFNSLMLLADALRRTGKKKEGKKYIDKIKKLPIPVQVKPRLEPIFANFETTTREERKEGYKKAEEESKKAEVRKRKEMEKKIKKLLLAEAPLTYQQVLLPLRKKLDGKEKKSEKIDLLVKWLSHKDPDIRVWSAFHLTRMGKEALPAFEEVKKRLKDKKEFVVYQVLRAIERMGKKAPYQCQKELLELIPHENRQIREGALGLLKKIGHPSKEVKEKVIQLIKTPSSKGHTEAIFLLGHWKIKNKEIIPLLVKKIEEKKNWTTVRLSQKALAAMGKTAYPAVEKFLKSKKAEEVLRGLEIVDSETEFAQIFLPHLEKLLTEASRPIQKKILEMCQYTLRKKGKKLASAMVSLFKGEKKREFQALLLEALIALETCPQNLIQPLLKMAAKEIKDRKDIKLRELALSALAHGGSESAEALLSSKKLYWGSQKGEIASLLASQGPEVFSLLKKATQKGQMERAFLALTFRLDQVIKTNSPLKTEEIEKFQRNLKWKKGVKEIKIPSQKAAAQFDGLLKILETALAGKDKKRREAATSAIKKVSFSYSPAAAPLVWYFLNLFYEPEDQKKGKRPQWSEMIKLSEKELARVLVKITTHPRASDYGGYYALEAVKALGKKGAPAVPILVKILKRKKGPLSSMSQNQAADALAAMGEKAAPAVAVVIEMIKKEEKAIFNYIGPGPSPILMILASVGEKAAPAVPYLLEAIEKWKGDKAKPRSIARALSGIGKPAVLPLVKKLKSAKEFRMKGYILHIFENMDKGEAARAVPSLVELFNSTDHPRLKRAVVDVLGNIGPKAAPAVPHLLKVLYGREKKISSWIVSVLGKIGPKAAPAVPILIYRLQGDRTDLWVPEALGKIGPKAAPAVPHLLKKLKSVDDYDKDDIIEALGKIGPKAAPAVPRLLRLASQPSEGLYDPGDKVEEALLKILKLKEKK